MERDEKKNKLEMKKENISFLIKATRGNRNEEIWNILSDISRSRIIKLALHGERNYFR